MIDTNEKDTEKGCARPAVGDNEGEYGTELSSCSEIEPTEWGRVYSGVNGEIG